LICIFICTPICTKFYSCKKWVLQLYQGSPQVEPPPELLKRLLTKSFAGSSEGACEGYRMSNRVDRKVQSKVKSLESEHVVHFLPAPVSLVKE
jgi:hypothetical protein